MTKISDVVSEITHAANAVDVDTVDGQHASEFAPAVHNHDDRYYTESEFDAIIAGLAHTTTTKKNGSSVIYTGGGYGYVYLNYLQ